MKKLINITSEANLDVIRKYVDCNSTQAVNFALACVARAILARAPEFLSDNAKNGWKRKWRELRFAEFRHNRLSGAIHGNEWWADATMCGHLPLLFFA